MIKKLIFILMLLLMPTAYSEIGMLTIDGNDIELLVDGRSMTFDNSTRGAFQFLLPECDKTQFTNCNIERKHGMERNDALNLDLQQSKNKISRLEIENEGNLKIILYLRSTNSQLKEQNRWLIILLISNIVILFFVLLAVYLLTKDDRPRT